MAKSGSSNPNDGPSNTQPRYRPNWLALLVGAGVGLWLLVAMCDYDPRQRGLLLPSDTTDVRLAGVNWAGRLGTDFARLGFVWLGVAAWFVPLLSLWVAWLAMRFPRRLGVARLVAMVLTVVAACGLLAMLELKAFHASQWFPEGRLGGEIGRGLYEGILKNTLGDFGSLLLLGGLYAGALVFVLVRDVGASLDGWMQRMREARAARAKARELAAEEARRQRPAVPPPAAPVAAPPPPVKAGGVAPASGVFPATPLGASAPRPPDAKAAAALKLPRNRAPGAEDNAAEEAAAPAAVPALKGGLAIVKPEATKKAKITLPQSDDANYQFPPLSLLKEQVRPAADSDEEYKKNMADLVRILGEFDVAVTPGEIHVGPVITRYELSPAAGVRVEKIAGLDKNIALGMRAQSVRILAPIPGKAAVGVEVPNLHPTPVGMREILESEDWANARADLPIALGKDVSGKPLVSDLAKMPHLLIAGATGSGKSVCINSIVASILYSKSPKDVRLIMVDPKVVELKIFNSLPHMLIPVVTEPKKVPAALKWLLNEMEQRYQMFARENVRNIAGFNTRKKGPKADPAQPALDGLGTPAADEGGEPAPERFPYIVAIIDELADLMMVAPAEIETSIARLAQLARAAGIHLIIATQRPSVNVITGVIKANLPSRIAFQVASQVDSRTILDGKGADTLIGRGDMLFSPPGSSRLVRAQGAFVADEEVQAMVEFLKKNGPPQYAYAVQEQIDRAAAEDAAEEAEDAEDNADLNDDELMKKCVDVLRSSKRASTSMLQRRLSIGYNRAARMMDMMEERGIVGPENGSSPREILKDLDSL